VTRPRRQTDGDGRLTETFRQDRVDHLRQQIADGTYRVSERDVATAMIAQGFRVTGKSAPRR
jgi:anti-sigma28 factor (negative regulator of flagellin synthesis)